MNSNSLLVRRGLRLEVLPFTAHVRTDSIPHLHSSFQCGVRNSSPSRRNYSAFTTSINIHQRRIRTSVEQPHYLSNSIDRPDYGPPSPEPSESPVKFERYKFPGVNIVLKIPQHMSETDDMDDADFEAMLEKNKETENRLAVTAKNYEKLLEVSVGDKLAELAMAMATDPDLCLEWHKCAERLASHPMDHLEAFLVFYCMALLEFSHSELLSRCLERIGTQYNSAWAHELIEESHPLSYILKQFPGYPHFRLMVEAIPIKHKTKLVVGDQERGIRQHKMPKEKSKKLPTWETKLPVDMEEWEANQERVTRTRYVQARPPTGEAPPAVRLKGLVALHLLESLPHLSTEELVQVSTIFSHGQRIFKGTLNHDAVEILCRELMKRKEELEPHILALTSSLKNCDSSATSLDDTKPFLLEHRGKSYPSKIPTAYIPNKVPPLCALLWEHLFKLIGDAKFDIRQQYVPYGQTYWDGLQDVNNLDEDTPDLDIIWAQWEARVISKIVSNVLIFAGSKASSMRASSTSLRGIVGKLQSYLIGHEILDVTAVSIFSLAEVAQLLDAFSQANICQGPIIVSLCTMLANVAGSEITELLGSEYEWVEKSEPWDEGMGTRQQFHMSQLKLRAESPSLNIGAQTSLRRAEIRQVFKILQGSPSDLTTILACLDHFKILHPGITHITSTLCGAMNHPSAQRLVQHGFTSIL